MNSTAGSEYTENIYIHLKLIFAFAAQSGLSEVRNDNVLNAVRTHGTCAMPTRYGSIHPAYTNQFVIPVPLLPYLLCPEYLKCVGATVIEFRFF